MADKIHADRVTNNTLVLSNATELAMKVIEQLAGNQISTHYRGEEFTGRQLADTIVARIQSNFSRYMERV